MTDDGNNIQVTAFSKKNTAKKHMIKEMNKL
jgi:hypothetical protein